MHKFSLVIIQNKRSFVLPFSEVCVALSGPFEMGVKITIGSLIIVMKKWCTNSFINN